MDSQTPGGAARVNSEGGVNCAPTHTACTPTHCPCDWKLKANGSLDPFQYEPNSWTLHETARTLAMLPVSIPRIMAVQALCASMALPQAIVPCSMQTIGKAMAFAGGITHIEYQGRVDHDVRILVSNHVSIYDSLVILAHTPVSPIVKGSYQDVPGVGRILKNLDAVFVNRSMHGAAINEHVSAEVRDLVSKVGASKVLIYPEATTHTSNSLLEFKEGAFEFGLPIQPITLRFVGHEDFDLQWTAGGPGFFESLVRGTSQFTNRAIVSFLPTYYPNAEEKINPALYAAGVRAYMAKSMDVPLSCLGLHDSLLRSHFDNHECVKKIRVAYFRERFEMRAADLIRHVAHFRRVHHDKLDISDVGQLAFDFVVDAALAPTAIANGCSIDMLRGLLGAFDKKQYSRATTINGLQKKASKSMSSTSATSASWAQHLEALGYSQNRNNVVLRSAL